MKNKIIKLASKNLNSKLDKEAIKILSLIIARCNSRELDDFNKQIIIENCSKLLLMELPDSLIDDISKILRLVSKD